MAEQRGRIGWLDLNLWRFYTVGPAVMLGVRAMLYPQPCQDAPADAVHHEKSRQGCCSLPQHVPCVQDDFQGGGAAGIWKGFGAKALGLCAGFCYITVFEFSRHHLRDAIGDTGADMAAGTAAALVSQTMSFGDVVAQRQMVARGTMARPSRIQNFEQIIHEVEYAVYTGDTARPCSSTCRRVSSGGHPMESIRMQYLTLPETSLRGEHGSWYDTDSRRAIAQSISGGLAGATTGAMTSPLDVIKVRRQLGRTEMSTLRVARGAAYRGNTRIFQGLCR